MIWIRADANKEIGTGHVMRCLSVAAALKGLGLKVCFLVADDNPTSLLSAKGQEYIVLDSDYRNPEAELSKLKEIFAQAPREDNFFLADSYFVTAEYFRRIRAYMPVGYVDDKCLTEFPVDILINYNIFANESLYERMTCMSQNKPELLLGTQYAPLREEFVQVPYKVRKQAKHVLITTGGSDKYNLAGRILLKAMENPVTAGLEYKVVSGVYNVHYPQLKELEERYPNIHICSNVSNMSELMQESDIAVTAGGSTMYELSAVGVPIICFSFVDNQEKIVEGFVEKEMVCYGGNYLRSEEKLFEEVVEQIALLAENVALRESYSARQRNVVDGEGALRIARALEKQAG